MQYKKILYIIGIFMTFFVQENSMAVNIISWWGYFNKEIISELERECACKVSYDEFYSIDEFLRRFQEQEYSIAIFPQSTYNFVSHKIAQKGANISHIKKTYAPNVLSSDFAKNLPDNVGIFAIEAAGFLYHTEKLNIDPSKSLEEIFTQLKGKKIIILDNPIEPMKLVAKLGENLDPSEAIQRFKKLFTGIEVILSNDIANFINDDQIVLLHAWIGNSYEIIKKYPKFKFFHHPKVSYIGGDLIASLNNSVETSCVVRALSGKKFNTKILSRDFRMSPFGILSSSNIDIEKLYLSVNNEFFDQTYNNLKWHGRPSISEFHKISDLWQKIKLEIRN